jgi:hypothetical protein
MIPNAGDAGARVLINILGHAKNSQRLGEALADIRNSPRGRVSWMLDRSWGFCIGGDAKAIQTSDKRACRKKVPARFQFFLTASKR